MTISVALDIVEHDSRLKRHVMGLEVNSIIIKIVLVMN